ncbi:dynein axonemal light chain 1 isoform X1 [Vanacampus margaritifer]
MPVNVRLTGSPPYTGADLKARRWRSLERDATLAPGDNIPRNAKSSTNIIATTPAVSEKYIWTVKGGKATTIKEALTRWEEKTGEKCGEATVVKLYGQIPPIEKLDNTLNKIPNCEKLSMSTNCIDKITNLGELKNLKILSLGRNNIKAFTGLDAVGDTLEELWISYNLIEKMKGVHLLKKLRVLYMTNNLVKDWGEFSKLADLPCLVDLVFVGNPLEEKHTPDGTWMDEATKRLPRLTKLDGIPVIKQDAGEDDD